VNSQEEFGFLVKQDEKEGKKKNNKKEEAWKEE
jgi:hypothetical protein